MAFDIPESLLPDISSSTASRVVFVVVLMTPEGVDVSGYHNRSQAINVARHRVKSAPVIRHVESDYPAELRPVFAVCFGQSPEALFSRVEVRRVRVK